MSWSEVKKMNSNLSVPINVAKLINHIDLAGSMYNVGGLYREVIESNELYLHPIASSIIGSDVTSTEEKMNAMGYIWVCKAVGLDAETYTTLSSILSSPTAMTLVATNKLVMDILFLHTYSINLLLGNNTAWASVVASTVAMTSLTNSVPAMTALANNTTRLPSVFASMAIRTMLFDSLIASAILMNSANLSRQWMLDNVSTTSSVSGAGAGSTTWGATLASKAFGLRAKFASTVSSGAWGGFRSPLATNGALTYADFSVRCTDFAVGVATTGSATRTGTAVWVKMAD